MVHGIEEGVVIAIIIVHGINVKLLTRFVMSSKEVVRYTARNERLPGPRGRIELEEAVG